MLADKKNLKPIVITGGASGIGLETAKLLVETGEFHVALVGRERGKLEDVADRFNRERNADVASAFTCDLADPAQVQKTADRILATHKTLYGLVNNAGIYPFGGISDTTEQSWNRTLQVNLTAPFQLSRALLPALTKNPDGGRIVNVSSTAGILPNHFALAYSVSKAALIHFTKTLAKEVGKDNVTVNCVCPGIVKSPLHEAYHTSVSELEEFYAKRGAAFPMGRVGEPKDIASAILFFLNKNSSWITGDVLVIDGGRLLL